jgi:hypothetical protein
LETVVYQNLQVIQQFYLSLGRIQNRALGQRHRWA